MSNELTIPGGFRVERSNKSGTRTVTRDALGVLLSGNKDERAQMCSAVMSGMWSAEADVGNYHPLLDNVARVFPEAAPWMRTVRGQRFPAKAQVVATFESVSLLTGKNGTLFKGEKGVMVRYCADLVDQYHIEVAEKEARKLAYEAEKRNTSALEMVADGRCESIEAAFDTLDAIIEE